MHTFFKEYLNCVERLHADIKRAVEGLPQVALDWTPALDIPSICVLITHLTGAERYWIGDVAGGDPSGRDRDAEFRAQGVPLTDLMERLDSTLAYAQRLLATWDLGDLEAMRTSPRDGLHFSAAWTLLHTLEHTAIHLGHMQILRQLWEQNQSQAT